MNKNRSAFTLIELMVTVVILIVLAGMLIIPMRGILSGSKEKATRATILKLDQLIRQAEQEMERAALNGNDREEKMSISVSRKGSTEQIRLATRLRKKAHFPQNKSDYEFKINTSPPLPPGAQDPPSAAESLINKKKAELGIPDLNSSEIMYLLLTEGSIFGVSLADSGSFTAAEIKDTDNNGAMEFVDAWGNPLRFYRWPTGLLRPEGLKPDGSVGDFTLEYWEMVSDQKKNTTTMQQDPLDTRNYDEMFLRQNHNTFYTPKTYHTYLIISAGPDGELGLHEPEDFTSGGQFAKPRLDDPNHKEKLNDSITNLQLGR